MYDTYLGSVLVLCGVAVKVSGIGLMLDFRVKGHSKRPLPHFCSSLFNAKFAIKLDSGSYPS